MISSTRPIAGTTVVARLETDRATAERIADIVAETYDADAAAAAIFEQTAGRWGVALHFSAPPNKTAVRALVALVAGPATANALRFERIAAKDWVRASLDGLRPVTAGRFFVHGAHDRARVAANQIGIEIEAALAFGTGHHGTTRGCLLALDHAPEARSVRAACSTSAPAAACSRSPPRAHCAAASLATDIDAVGGARRARNVRLNRVGALIDVVHAAGVAAHVRAARAIRSRLRQYSARSAQATGNASHAPARTQRARRSVRPADRAGECSDLGLSRDLCSNGAS